LSLANCAGGTVIANGTMTGFWRTPSILTPGRPPKRSSQASATLIWPRAAKGEGQPAVGVLFQDVLAAQSGGGRAASERR
jgi:hypothetical protein